MAILHIKNVPDDLHAELRRRAQLDGMTIRDYVLGLIRRDQALPPRQEWLARVQRLPPVRLDRPGTVSLRPASVTPLPRMPAAHDCR